MSEGGRRIPEGSVAAAKQTVFFNTTFHLLVFSKYFLSADHAC
jgi:hypothetical protein